MKFFPSSSMPRNIINASVVPYSVFSVDRGTFNSLHRVMKASIYSLQVTSDKARNKKSSR